MKDKILGVIKKLLVWGVLPIAFLTFLFVMGEQFEVGRLSAVAACKDCPDVGLCLREKGYLENDPYYPDLTRARLCTVGYDSLYPLVRELSAAALKENDTKERKLS